MVRVMVVEDDPGLRLLYRRELERDGYVVLVAASGEECLQRMERDTPDLVVMNIRMPGLDGIETMGRIRERDRSFPVVFNTAYDSYRDDFRTWVADEYVTKSSDSAQLRSAVRRVLASRERSKSLPSGA
jgi:CheY-like chemotaxis protein